MAYLYTPPTQTIRERLEGSLYYTYQVSSTVWLDDTGWHQQFVGDPEVTSNASLVFTRATVVSNEVAASLLASSVGGTVQLMEPGPRGGGFYGSGIYGEGIYGGTA